MIYFWPVQLYGDTNYILLLGKSMYPTIDSGTLIVTKLEENYLVGDIIAFVNEDNSQIVHRIVKETEQGFVTRGDNNSQNDPGVITEEDIIGRAVFVLPYLGFTGLFIKTPLGMAIFALFAVMILASKKPSKTKTGGQQSFAVYNVALVLTIGNYVMIQIALGGDIRLAKMMSIPFIAFFQPFLASTVSFAMLSMVIIMLRIIAQKVDDNPNENNPLKVIFTLGTIMIMITQLLHMFNLFPFFIKVVEEQLLPQLMNFIPL